MKLKMIWKVSLFIIALILEVILYTLIGGGLSITELIYYTLGIINTSVIVVLGITISDELGYK